MGHHAAQQKKNCIGEKTIKKINKKKPQLKKNTLRQMIMKKQPFKIYGMPQKQCLEGSSQLYRPSSKKEEKSQIDNLTYNLKNLEK